MPRKYAKRRRTRPRRNRRVRKRYTPMHLLRSPLGKSHKAILRYVERGFTVNPGVAGVATAYYFSANGLYDPNITGTGHQPVGFDQMMAMFDHYTVIGARAKFQFYSIDGTYKQLVLVGLDDATTQPLDIGQTLENGTCRWKLISNASAGDQQTHTLSYKVNPAKFLGRSKPMSCSELRGDASNNPEEQVYFKIVCSPQDGTDTAGIECMVTIDYTVIFTEPKELAQS